MTPAKISFSLNAPRTATRKRPRSGQSASEGDRCKVRQFTGCFDATEDDANQADIDDGAPHLPGMPNKHPRLQLEDAAAKVKRLQSEGNTLAEAGRFRAAMARWMEAVDVDPQNAVLYELLAQACMALYEDFRAIQFALKATELDPSWGEGFHTLARCHLNYGELDLALKHSDKAMELLGATEELLADRQEIQTLLVKQQDVLARREAEASVEVDEGKLQAISCLKHLALRAQTTIEKEEENARSSYQQTR
ncbi:hypothetical protein FI667_g3852, partial [Globisporangium splendens]